MEVVWSVVTLASHAVFSAAAASRRSIVIFFDCVRVSLTSLCGCVELRDEVVFELFVHEAAHNHVEEVVKDDCCTTNEGNIAPDGVHCTELNALFDWVLIHGDSGNDFLVILDQAAWSLLDILKQVLCISSIVEWLE